MGTRDPANTSDDVKILQRERWRWHKQLARTLLLLCLIGISFVVVELFDLERITAGFPATVRLLKAMWPPDFSRLPQWVGPMLDTLAMSVAGTAIAIALALPMGLLAARNTTTHRLAFYPVRILLNLARAIPELILGMVLVAAVGFGKLPGTLALGLHSVGMVGKFFAEAIELSDQAPVEAARAVGATHPQVIVHAVLPQVLPQMVDVTFYRWEYNFRASMVLGAVGAGGIGAEIISALRILQYQQVAALLILVLVMVTLVDSLGSYLRKQFVVQ